MLLHFYAATPNECQVRLRLDVQGDEHQTLADLLRPLVGDNEGAALAFNLGDAHAAILLEAPRPRRSHGAAATCC